MKHLTPNLSSTPPDNLLVGRGAFTLLEVLLAIVILGIVMVVVHSVFNAAIQLRNKTDATFAEAIPLQHALATLKRDLANLTLPGGTLSGTLQTTPTTNTSSSLSHTGEHCGPTFYTTSGTLSELEPWSEMRRVDYYLVQSTNASAGLDLLRSVTRNLLPAVDDEYSDQRLLSGVSQLTFQFYDGTSWQDDWDSADTSSSTYTNPLPIGIRVQLTLVNEKGVISRDPVEMVIPININASTNIIATVGGGG